MLSSLRILLYAGLGLLAVFALLFVPAGTLYWPEAWVLILLFFIYFAFAVFWLSRHNPELLEERTAAKIPKEGWDKIILLVSSIATLAILVVAGIDAVRLQLSVISIGWKIVGFVGTFFALCFNFWAMSENKFASRIVELQPEKKQKVISTGAYAVVRHPMYAAFILMFFCISLALGSLYALIPWFFAALALVARTVLEDRMLQKELPGYKEYAKKVQCKLLPCVW